MYRFQVGVIAGTPVDTKMGVDFLLSKGIRASSYPVSISPQEQSKLQILSKNDLYVLVQEIVNQCKYEGMDFILVYCNSLSAAIDMESISRQENIQIFTPLDAYKHIVKEFKYLGILAANNQSCAGIEKTIQETNPDCFVVGIGILPLVLAIEELKEPMDIIDHFALKLIIHFYETIGAEAIILGCTHFSYIGKEIESLSNIKIIDPSEIIFDLIVSCNLQQQLVT